MNMRKKFGIFLMTIGILLFALYFAARLIPTYYSGNGTEQQKGIQKRL